MRYCKTFKKQDEIECVIKIEIIEMNNKNND